MYKFDIRYYNPTLGRWMQQDPLGGSLFDPSTGNRYAYTNDDPTNLTDPTGATPFGSCQRAAAIGVVAGIVGGLVAGPALLFAGAALGVTTTAITGTAILDAALLGSIEGGVFGGVSGCVAGALGVVFRSA